MSFYSNPIVKKIILFISVLSFLILSLVELYPIIGTSTSNTCSSHKIISLRIWSTTSLIADSTICRLIVPMMLIYIITGFESCLNGIKKIFLVYMAVYIIWLPMGIASWRRDNYMCDNTLFYETTYISIIIKSVVLYLLICIAITLYMNNLYKTYIIHTNAAMNSKTIEGETVESSVTIIENSDSVV